MNELVLAAITLGFLGSFHCVGMCGPIALSLPVHNKSQAFKIAGISLYNIGRMLAYTMFGILIGVVGESLVINGFQQALSIVAGLMVLVIFFFQTNYSQKLFHATFFYKSVNALKNQIILLFKKNSLSSLFLIGFLNGFLPCGLVYLAVAGALAAGGVYRSGLFMMFFGLGTVPAMFVVAYASNLITVGLRNKIRKVVPVFVVSMAVVLILRGMNLGIPYLSPSVAINQSTGCVEHQCCHKK